MLSDASAKIILKWKWALGSQVSNGNESGGAYAERRKRFITEANTSVDGQNNLKRGESGDWGVKLLKELKSEAPTLSGASAKIILKVNGHWEVKLIKKMK